MPSRITYDDVAKIAMSLPEVTEGPRFSNRTWFVAKKAFAWARPFSKADINRFGEDPIPNGEILAVSVENLHEKEAILAEGLPGFFTIEHFNNYPAVLIQLNKVRRADLGDAIVDGWLACAPNALAEAYLAKKKR